MRNSIFIDFDGTLVECQKRIYKLFSALISPAMIEEERYWQARAYGMRQKVLLKEHLGYSDAECDLFSDKWLSLIEADEWLALDVPRSGSDYLLSSLAGNYNVFLVTNRQSREKVIRQLTSFGWLDYFQDILVTEHKCTKAELIRKRMNADQKSLLIGDTCEDIKTAKILGISGIAVRSQIESWEKVLSAGPVDSVEDLHEVFTKLESIFTTKNN